MSAAGHRAGKRAKIGDGPVGEKVDEGKAADLSAHYLVVTNRDKDDAPKLRIQYLWALNARDARRQVHRVQRNVLEEEGLWDEGEIRSVDDVDRTLQTAGWRIELVSTRFVDAAAQRAALEDGRVQYVVACLDHSRKVPRLCRVQHATTDVQRAWDVAEERARQHCEKICNETGSVTFASFERKIQRDAEQARADDRKAPAHQWSSRLNRDKKQHYFPFYVDPGDG